MSSKRPRRDATLGALLSQADCLWGQSHRELQRLHAALQMERVPAPMKHIARATLEAAMVIPPRKKPLPLAS